MKVTEEDAYIMFIVNKTLEYMGAFLKEKKDRKIEDDYMVSKAVCLTVISKMMLGVRRKDQIEFLDDMRDDIIESFEKIKECQKNGVFEGL